MTYNTNWNVDPNKQMSNESSVQMQKVRKLKFYCIVPSNWIIKIIT